MSQPWSECSPKPLATLTLCGLLPGEDVWAHSPVLRRNTDRVPPGGSVVQGLGVGVLMAGVSGGCECLISPPLIGCVTLVKLLVLSDPVSSSAGWVGDKDLSPGVAGVRTLPCHVHKVAATSGSPWRAAGEPLPES